MVSAAVSCTTPRPTRRTDLTKPRTVLPIGKNVIPPIFTGAIRTASTGAPGRLAYEPTASTRRRWSSVPFGTSTLLSDCIAKSSDKSNGINKVLYQIFLIEPGDGRDHSAARPGAYANAGAQPNAGRQKGTDLAAGPEAQTAPASCEMTLDTQRGLSLPPLTLLLILLPWPRGG